MISEWMKVWLVVVGLNFGAQYVQYGCGGFVAYAEKRASLSEERLEFKVKEGVPTGRLIGKIKKRPNYKYRLNEKNPWFSFSSDTGEIRTGSELDRETLPSDVVDLVILATGPSTYFITIRIFIEDLNDNYPYFPFPFQNISIPESADIGTQLRVTSAQDPDSGRNGRISRYEIVSGNEDKSFVLDQSGSSLGELPVILQVAKELDRESKALHVLNISASDSGKPEKRGFVTVFVNVLDSNDNPPVFQQSHYRASVSESIEAGSSILQVQASDADSAENAQIMYHISNDPESQFEVDSISGIITTKVTKLNCPESGCEAAEGCSRVCVFTVEAVDHGIPAQRGRAFVNVQILDENDHDPQILFRIYPKGSEYATVDETKQTGSVIAVVTVVDADSGENGQTAVEIERGNELEHFRLESNDLFSLIRVNAPLDREKLSKYNLSILATDFGNPPRFARKFLPIYVRDVNDQPPVFQQAEYAARIPESSAIGSFVASVSAKDMDESTEGGPVSGIMYSIISGNEDGQFALSARTGLITTAAFFHFEQKQHYSLKIRATDGGLSSDTSIATVEIDLIDSNNHMPTFTKSHYRIRLSESAPIGSEIVHLSASDLDTGASGRLSFQINPETSARFPGQFRIDSSSGRITLGRRFDREEQSFYRFVVTVTDSGTPEMSDTAFVLVEVLDENDERPVFYPIEYYANVIKSNTGKTHICKIRAEDMDSGNNSRINYFLYDAPIGLFQMDSSSGNLFLIKQPKNPANIRAIIGATDGKNTPASNNATVHVFFVNSSSDLPRFLDKSVDVSIKEDEKGSSTVGKVIGTLSASDVDASPIEYKILDGDPNGMFEIGQYSGEIRSTRAMDREKNDFYSLTIGALGKSGVSHASLQVSIIDGNDNSPKFLAEDKIHNGIAECTVEKAWPIGHPVFYATATDKDSGDNGRLNYTLKSPSKEFWIDSVTGLISLGIPGFLLPKDIYELEVSVSDSGIPPNVASFSLRISVNSSRDSASYDSYQKAIYVNENLTVNSMVEKLPAQHETAYFGATYDDPDAPFGVFPDGWLFVKNPLDYETLNAYQLNVIRFENMDSYRISKTLISVEFHILDVNDNAPICRNHTFHFDFPENEPGLSVIGFLNVEDGDSGLNGKLSFELLSEKEKLSLDAVTGLLSSKMSFDREEMLKTTGSTHLHARFRVSDYGPSNGEVHSAECEIEIQITDRNDETPQFGLEMYVTSVPENKETGSELMRLTATDADEGINAAIHYEILSGNEDGNFDLENKTGRLILKKPLDRENVDSYRLTILARDLGSPTLSSTAMAIVEVTDVNDQVPTFVDYPTMKGLNLSESLPLGSFIAQFRAVDKDIGSAGRVRYFIATGNIGRTFEMNPVTGRMILIKPLDFEAVPAYTLTVSATDEGAPSLSASVPVVMNVLDANDNAPLITTTSLVGQVSENVPPGTRVLSVTATDPDSGLNGRVRFSLVQQVPKLAFHIDENTGEIFTAAELDREDTDSYILRLRAEDTPANTSMRMWTERSITIIVTDTNDHAPVFTGPHAAVAPVGARTGQKIAQMDAKDSDAGKNGSVGFTLHEDSVSTTGIFGLEEDGTLYLKRAVSYSSMPLYHMTVIATDRRDLPETSRLASRSGRAGKDELKRTTSIQFTVVISSSAPTLLAFSRDSYDLDVSEGSSVGTEIGSVHASEQGSSSKIEYYVTRVRSEDSDISSAEAVFDVDRDTGAVRITRQLDRETVGGSVLLDVYAVNSQATEPHATSSKVHITIHDANDEAPVPSQSEYDLEVLESAEVGSVVGKIMASDPDLYGKIVFTLTNQSSPFFLDPESGEIRTKNLLDRESQAVYNLEVNINDGQQSTFVPVHIEVKDVNDEAPEFIFPPGSGGVYSFSVLEGAQRNSYIGRVEARDGDAGTNSKILYRLLNSELDSVFNLEEDTGIITVNGYLDHEEHPVYFLNIQAIDKGSPPMMSRAEVFIDVLDLNDNPPIFSPSHYQVSIPEDVPVGTSLLTLSVQDPDTDTEFDFSISSGDPWDNFMVNGNGTVSVGKPLDRELRPVYHLTVTVIDRQSSENLSSRVRHRATAQVGVSLLDVNDNPPKFTSSLVAAVAESAPIGTIVTTVRATDPDQGLNGQVEIHLDPGSAGVFSVDPVLGFVSVIGELDREDQDMYNLTLWASDRGAPERRTRGSLLVKVLDDDDNVPGFTRHDYELTLPEDTPVGKSLLQLTALDRDVGQNAAVKFWVLAGDPRQEFHVSPDTGILSVAKTLDYERESVYNLTIALSGVFDTSGEWSDVSSVLVTVTDINDNAPYLPSDPVFIDIVENFPKNLPAVIGKLGAMDPDSGLNGKLSYSIVQGNTTVFRVDSLSGELIALKQLDRESQASYSLQVQISDSGIPRQQTTGTIVVRVLDSNDNTPVFSQPYYVAEIRENVPEGTEVTTLKAWDADDGINGLIRYEILGDSMLFPFQIDVFSGVVRTRGALDREATSEYSLRIRASDSALGQPFFRDVTLNIRILDVNDNSPTIKNGLFDLYIKNSLSKGDFVYAVEAFDFDSGANGDLEYSLSGDDVNKFQLNSSTGVITAAMSMKTLESYAIIVTVSDKGTASTQSTSATLHFYPLPPGNFPAFKAGGLVQSYSISELDRMSEVTRLLARSPKSAPFNKITYWIVAGNVGSAFEMDSHSGRLSSTQGLDREINAEYQLWIGATDSSSPPLSAFVSVRITVEDVNDNVPLFKQPVYNATVQEGDFPPVTVIQVQATDKDEGRNSKLAYSLHPTGNLDAAFTIDSLTGIISTEVTLDREKVAVYRLLVFAKDSGQPSLNSSAVVYVNVEDVNDNAPKFTRLFTASVPENAEIGSFVTQVTSSDPDSPQYSNNTYYFSSNPGGKFAIDPYTGNVTVAEKLDQESVNEYPLKVIAIDGSWRIETALTISVIDVNDNAPIFSASFYAFNVSEMLPSLSPVGKVSARDGDAPGFNSKISYRLTKKSDSFILDSNTGDIATLRPMFHHSEQPEANKYELTVVARDHGTPSKASSANVVVVVTKLNRFPPVFEKDHYVASITRDAMVGSKLVHITAVDNDTTGSNGYISYSMTDDSGLFAVDPVTGWLRTAGPMAKERTKYALEIIAADHGNPQKQATASVEIWVLSMNAHPPTFPQAVYEVTAEENIEIGHRMILLSASDPDPGMNGDVSYRFSSPSLSSLPFSLDPQSGWVTVNGTLDHELIHKFNLTVIAEDKGFPPKSGSAQLKVTVQDRNDNFPVFTRRRIDVDVMENAAGNTPIATLKAKDTDSPPNNSIRYKIISGNQHGFFLLNAETGKLFVARGAHLDYERQNTYQLETTASDSDTGAFSKLTVVVHVTSVNEYPPKFLRKLYKFQVGAASMVGMIVGKVDAIDSDGGADGVIFYYFQQSSKGKGFSINRKTGEIIVSENFKHVSSSKSIQLSAMAKNRYASSRDQVDSCSIEITIANELKIPMFNQLSYQSQIVENSPIGTSVVSLRDFLVDTSVPKLRYGIVNGNTENAFSVDAGSGLVQVGGSLDRERKEAYDLVVSVMSEVERGMKATASLHVNILDVNDNGPHLEDTNKKGYVMEGDPAGTNIMQLLPRDSDIEPNRGPFKFRLLSHDLASRFDIDPETGILRTTTVFDREEKDDYQLLIEITDSGIPPQSTAERVTVVIRDMNDMPSSNEPLVVVVKSVEETLISQILGPIKPADQDIVGNYQCQMSGEKSAHFLLGTDCIVAAKKVRVPSTHELQITGNDGIHPSVTYNVSLQFHKLEKSFAENAVEMRVEGRSRDLLSDFMEHLKEILRREAVFPDLLAVEPMSQGHDVHRLLLALQDSSQKLVAGKTASGFYHGIREEMDSISKLRIINITYDLCDRNPCENGGECSLVTKILPKEPFMSLESGRSVLVSHRIRRSFHCECGKSFAGERCEVMIDHCANSPCANDGTCKHSADGSVHCACRPQFTGRFCEVDVNECGDGSVGRSPCLNGGYCENHPGSYRCICLVGFSGKNCEVSVDHCSSQPCLNDGVCEKESNGYSCKCPSGYSGKNCGIRSYGFTEESYIELPPLNPQENYIALEFATKSKDALLLYSYNGAQGSGDYVGVDIVDGHVRLSASLAGQGRMNLGLKGLRVSDGEWYQVEIQHKFQTVTLTLGKCQEEAGRCQPCPTGDMSCRLTAHIGLHQILVPGDSILLGGVKSFGDLLTRAGQISSFSFVGCIRAFEMNGKSLEEIRIKSQKDIQNFCPRREKALCGGELSDTCGSSAVRCTDGWSKPICICKGLFSAHNCDEAWKPYSFNGGYVEYKLSEQFRRELLFQPVDPDTLVNSDDLIRRRKRTATVSSLVKTRAEFKADYWIQLEIRTFSTDGLIFFAASAADFSIIDLWNGTLRYMSKSGEHQIQLPLNESRGLSDGHWHKIELQLGDRGRTLQLTADGAGKRLKSRHPLHFFLGPKLTRMTIGGLKTNPDQATSAVKAFGVQVPEFIGCIRKFVLNNEAQPLGEGRSGFLEGRVVGEVGEGCSGALGCVSPPCTLSPLGKSPGMSVGVMAVLIFFAIMFVFLIVAWVIVRKIRVKRQHKSPQSSKLSNIAIISSGSINGSVKGDPRIGSGDLAPSRNETPESGISLGFPPSRRRPPASPSIGPPPYGMHMGNGAYQNHLDTLSDERMTAERYDLDNASSIAPSDIEVSYHYRGYREGGSVKRQPLTNPQLAKIRSNGSQRSSPSDQVYSLNNAMFRNSPSSVKQLKAALRSSPASLGTGRGSGSSEEGPSIASQRSKRPGSAHSGRSRRKGGNGSRSSSRGKGSLKRTPRGGAQGSKDGSILSVKDLRRYQSNPSFEDDSSSSSNEQPPVPPMRRFPPSAPRILSRSPHAPPLRDSTSEESERESFVCSELDLDKIRKPRRLLSMADETETESEAGGGHQGSVPTSLAPFRPPRSMFPVSEDESDAPSLPFDLQKHSPSAFQPILGPKNNIFQLRPSPKPLSISKPAASDWYEEASGRSSSTEAAQKSKKPPNMEAYV